MVLRSPRGQGAQAHPQQTEETHGDYSITVLIYGLNTKNHLALTEET